MKVCCHVFLRPTVYIRLNNCLQMPTQTWNFPRSSFSISVSDLSGWTDTSTPSFIVVSLVTCCIMLPTHTTQYELHATFFCKSLSLQRNCILPSIKYKFSVFRHRYKYKNSISIAPRTPKVMQNKLCWTPQPVWSSVPTSSTEACRNSSITSYSGWMFLSESGVQTRRHGVQLPARSSASVLRGIVRISRRRRITATSPICHPDSSWSYRVTSSAPMANRLSVWPVCRPGIPCRPACGIQLLAKTVLDNLWRRFCSQRTDASSALEVSRRCAI